MQFGVVFFFKQLMQKDVNFMVNLWEDYDLAIFYFFIHLHYTSKQYAYQPVSGSVKTFVIQPGIFKKASE